MGIKEITFLDRDNILKRNVSYNYSQINLYATAIVHTYVSGLLGKHLSTKMTLAEDRSG